MDILTRPNRGTVGCLSSEHYNKMTAALRIQLLLWPQPTSSLIRRVPHRPTGPSAAHSRHFLKSYKWDAPNSCFFDNVMEIWCRAFSRWPDQKRALFLSWLPPRSALADFFYHFQRRLRWIASASPDDLDGGRELGLGQAKARYAIFTRWKLYSNPAAYGSSIVWIPHAIRVSG
jgi:hypothetical protein